MSLQPHLFGMKPKQVQETDKETHHVADAR